MAVDPFPVLTQNTFQNWKREIKLVGAGQPGASATQLLAKMIHILPLAVKTEALIYMEQTERNPTSRSISTVVDVLDSRFGRTDSERACSRLATFTEFKRKAQGNYKDFWARFTRCVEALEELGAPTNEKVAPGRTIRALRLPGGRLPIVLSAIETSPDRLSVSALREIAIRMYETRKPGGDSTEVFAVNSPVNPHSQLTYRAAAHSRYDGDGNWDEEDWASNYDSEITDAMLEDGSITLTKPKKPTNPRNTPGFTRRHAVGLWGPSVIFPIGKENGRVSLFVYGVAIHLVSGATLPHHYREKSDQRFSTTGKWATCTLEETVPVPHPGITTPAPVDRAIPSGES